MYEYTDQTDTCKIVHRDKTTEKYLLIFRAINILFIFYFLLLCAN